MQKAAEKDLKTKRRFKFLNDRPGSLGAAFQQKATWTYKMENFKDKDSLSQIDNDKGSKIDTRAKVYGLKKEFLQKNDAVHRDKDLVFQSIVDRQNKIVDDHKIFSGDFATDMERNKTHLYNTLSGFRSRRNTV